MVKGLLSKLLLAGAMTASSFGLDYNKSKSLETYVNTHETEFFMMNNEDVKQGIMPCDIDVVKTYKSGDFCKIQPGGVLTILDRLDSAVLVGYMRSQKDSHHECPNGAMTIMSYGEFKSDLEKSITDLNTRIDRLELHKKDVDSKVPYANEDGLILINGGDSVYVTEKVFGHALNLNIIQNGHGIDYGMGLFYKNTKCFAEKGGSLTAIGMNSGGKLLVSYEGPQNSFLTCPNGAQMEIKPKDFLSN